MKIRFGFSTYVSS